MRRRKKENRWKDGWIKAEGNTFVNQDEASHADEYSKLLGAPAGSCSIPKFENEGMIQGKYLLISNAEGVRFMFEKLY